MCTLYTVYSHNKICVYIQSSCVYINVCFCCCCCRGPSLLIFKFVVPFFVLFCFVLLCLILIVHQFIGDEDTFIYEEDLWRTLDMSKNGNYSTKPVMSPFVVFCRTKCVSSSSSSHFAINARQPKYNAFHTYRRNNKQQQ